MVLVGVIVGAVEIASITALGNADICENQWRSQDSDEGLSPQRYKEGH